MKKLAILILVLGMVPFAFGDQFTLQSYTVTALSSDPGLVLQTAGVANTPKTFFLNAGGSTTFDLFQIWTSETTVNYDDTVAQSISLDFAFNPPDSSGVVNGSTYGVSRVFGLFQYGVVTWSGPAVVDFGSGGQYTFALSNETFNLGLFGLDQGRCDGATVQATLTFTQPGSNQAPVPEPGSMLLVGTGLAGIARLVRRRKL